MRAPLGLFVLGRSGERKETGGGRAIVLNEPSSYNTLRVAAELDKAKTSSSPTTSRTLNREGKSLLWHYRSAAWRANSETG